MVGSGCRQFISFINFAVSPNGTAAKIADLREACELLEKKLAFIERQAAAVALEALARNRAGDKPGALLLVLKKNMHYREAHRSIKVRLFYAICCLVSLSNP